jgi:hypothetical protein
MTEVIKVKDSPELVRDISSRAILNTDRKGLQNYNLQREKILEQKREQQRTKDRLEKLESDIGDIKNILQELLVRSNNGN